MAEAKKRPVPPAPPATTIIVQPGGTMTREMYSFILDLVRSAQQAEAELKAIKAHLGI